MLDKTQHLGPLWAEGGRGTFTKKEDLYFQHLSPLNGKFPIRTVLEIGPGDGEFAKRLISLHDIQEYTFLDIDRNLQQAMDNVLTGHPKITLHGVASQEYHTIMKNKFDLVVSNVCIPETPKEYYTPLLSNLLPLAQGAMIIGQLAESDNEPDYEDWIKQLFTDSFEYTSCEPTGYAQCFALVGHK